MEKSNSHDEKVALKKGPWTREEDQMLLAFIEKHGHGSWRSLPAKAGLDRCGKSCRLRWTNYLRPDIKRGKFSTQEEKTIIRLHALLGNRWSSISTHLPSRTDNEIKNYWNTRLKKRLIRMGIDPVTHKPKNNSDQSRQLAAELSHMAQWETARLEAEAKSKSLNNFNLLRNATCPPPPPPPPLLPPCLDVLKAWQAISTHNSFFRPPNNSTHVVPTVGFMNGSSFMASDVTTFGVGMQVKGRMENSALQIQDNIIANSVDFGSTNYYSDNYNVMTSDIGGESEDISNYWKDLLNWVS